VQPDSGAFASFPTVPLVRIVDRESAGAVKVRKLLARHAAGDVVHAEWCLLVTFAQLVDAILAAADVVVGKIAHGAALVLEHVKRRFRSVDDDRMLLLGLKLYEIPWYTVRRPLVLITRESCLCFFAEVGDAIGRCAGSTPERLQRL
jgi:hypothetical protein